MTGCARAARLLAFLLPMACSPAPEPLSFPRPAGTQAAIITVEELAGDGASQVVFAVAIAAGQDYRAGDPFYAPTDDGLFRLRFVALTYEEALSALALPAGEIQAGALAGTGPAFDHVFVSIAAGEERSEWSELAAPPDVVARFLSAP